MRADILAGKAVIVVSIQDTIERQLKGIRTRLRDFSASMSEIGGDLFRGGAVGTAASIFPIKDFIEFDDQMLFMQTKLQATDRQMKEVARTVRDLGMSTSFTSTEVAKAGTMFAQAGFDAVEAQQSLQAALDLSRGSSVGLETSTTLLSNAIRTFHYEAADADMIASKFVTTARLGTLDIVDLGESLKYASDAFVRLNTPMEAALGMIATLSTAGIRGSMAGTSLNTAFINLAKNSDKLQQSLGVTLDPEDFRDPLIILEKLDAAMKGMSGSAQVEALAGILNIRGARAIGGLLGQGLERVRLNIEEISRSYDEARRNAAKMDSQLGGSFRRTKSAFEEMLLAIGATSEGPLTRLEKPLVGILNSVSRLSEVYPRFVQGLLASGPAALAAGVGILGASWALSKLAALATPLILLTNTIGNLAASIIGVHLNLLKLAKDSAVTGILGVVGKPDTKFPEALKKYQEQVKQFNEARVAQTRKAQTTLTALQQANQKKLIDLDRTFAARRLRVEQLNTQDFAKEVQRRASLQGTITDLQAQRQRLTTSSLLQKTETEISRLQQRRGRVEQAQQRELNKLFQEQAQARRDLVQQSIAQEGIVPDRLAARKADQQAQLLALRTQQQELVTTERLQKAEAARARNQARQAKMQQVQQSTLTRTLKEQAQAREALWNANAKRIQELEAGLPIMPQRGLTGQYTKVEERQLAARQKAEAALATFRDKAARSMAELQSKQARELATLQSRQGRDFARLQQAETKILRAQISERNKLTKAHDAIARQIVETETKLGRTQVQIEKALLTAANNRSTELIALETRQAKEVLRIRTQQQRALKDITSEEGRLLRTQLQERTKLQQAQVKLQERIQKTRQELAATPPTSPREERMFAQQHARRMKLQTSLQAREAAMAVRHRKQMAKLLRGAPGAAPVDQSSFLTRDRGPSLAAGLGSAFRDIGRMFSNLWKGLRAIDFRRVFRNIDVVRILHRSLTGIGGIIRGVVTALNGLRRAIFSFSGFLLIVESLILFGDRIPIVKDMLEALGTAFRRLGRDIAWLAQGVRPSFQLLQKGFQDILAGEGERGVRKLGLGFQHLGGIIKTTLIQAWVNFRSTLHDGLSRAAALGRGLLAVFNSIIAVLGSSLSAVFAGGQLLIGFDDKSGGLLESMKDIFSVENITTFFVGVVAAIESMGLQLLKVIATIVDTLNLIKETFFQMLRAVANIPFFGSKEARAQADALDENADERKALQEELQRLQFQKANDPRVSAGIIDPGELQTQIDKVEQQLATLGGTKRLSWSLSDMEAELKAATQQIIADLTTKAQESVPPVIDRGPMPVFEGVLPYLRRNSIKYFEEALAATQTDLAELVQAPSAFWEERQDLLMRQEAELAKSLEDEEQGLRQSRQGLTDYFRALRAWRGQDPTPSHPGSEVTKGQQNQIWDTLLTSSWEGAKDFISDQWKKLPEIDLPRMRKWLMDGVEQKDLIDIQNVGRALTGDFTSTRGQLIQMVPKLEKLQQEANDSLDSIDDNLSYMRHNPTPLVFG